MDKPFFIILIDVKKNEKKNCCLCTGGQKLE